MKRALIDITETSLAACVSILADAGIAIVGSVASVYERTVRLCAEGDGLPNECEGGDDRLLVVVPTIVSEAYGKQRITRIAGWTIHARGENGAPAR